MLFCVLRTRAPNHVMPMRYTTMTARSMERMVLFGLALKHSFDSRQTKVACQEPRPVADRRNIRDIVPGRIPLQLLRLVGDIVKIERVFFRDAAVVSRGLEQQRNVGSARQEMRSVERLDRF